jgi:cyclic 2,3-diphosphoglycerate synthetase
VKAVALIDGEHRADVVRDALAGLPYEWVGAILVGGTEKRRPGDDYGVPLVDGFGGAEVVVDVSDEPVLGPAERLRWASRALASGLPYVGADFRFDPPRLEPFELPSVSVVGTGKRVGKTAVSAHVARALARDRQVVAVAMGRGGPEEPEVVDEPPTLDELLARSRAGRHAASDHLELAALARVPTVGCRRAGGGLAGAVLASNVLAGAGLAAARAPDAVVFDGSGTALPPVATTARILVTSPAQDATAYLNLYRLLVSDLVVLLHGSEADVELLRAAAARPVVRAELRLRPVEPLTGRVAVFTAGPAAVDHLEADVVHVSAALGDRARLRALLERVEADTYLVELKAAAIDVVAEHARTHGRSVVLAGNDVVALEGDLDAEVAALLPSPVAAGERRT